jgi:hypothetical protein
MLRAAFLLCVLAFVGCTRNPYLIGEQVQQVHEAGIDECETALADALTCASFEDEDLASAWTATTIVDGGALERTTDPVHSGLGALHAATSAADSIAVVSTEFEPLFSGMLFLRAYLWVPAAVPTETINIFFIGAEPEPDPFNGLDINLANGALQIFSPQIIPARQTGALQIPRDRWFCFRAQLVIGEGDGTVDLFVDDQLALTAQALDTLPANGVFRLRAGVDWSSEQAELFEIYLDDIALDVVPIACDP